MDSSAHQSASKSQSYCVIDAPFGRLGIATEMVDGSLMVSKIDYLAADTPMSAPQNALAKECIWQCKQYFQNPAHPFDLPLKPAGTEYQKRVWKRVQEILPGLTRAYGEVAQDIQSGARAVGSACGANPYPLIVPCHRVVAASGIGGFMREGKPGFYRQIKIWLLKHEADL